MGGGREGGAIDEGLSLHAAESGQQRIAIAFWLREDRELSFVVADYGEDDLGLGREFGEARRATAAELRREGLGGGGMGVVNG